MKDEERDKFFVNSISEEIKKIESFVKDITYEDFLKDEKLQYAVYKTFENIGEASKNISQKTKQKHLEIPWKDMAGFRDKLSHSYFGVDIKRVWKAICKDIPGVKPYIKKLINEQNKGSVK
jgi:uncharacterized protein with HEPN domain